MAYYRITVTLKKGKTITGIREIDSKDVDDAWLAFRAHVHDAYGYGNVEDYRMEQLSKHSLEVKLYLIKKNNDA